MFALPAWLIWIFPFRQLTRARLTSGFIEVVLCGLIDDDVFVVVVCGVALFIAAAYDDDDDYDRHLHSDAGWL